MRTLKVITQGRPTISKLSKVEAKVFYETLLFEILEWKKNCDKSEVKTNETK